MDWFLYDNGLRHERVKWMIPKLSLHTVTRFLGHETFEVDKMSIRYSLEVLIIIGQSPCNSR